MRGAAAPAGPGRAGRAGGEPGGLGRGQGARSLGAEAGEGNGADPPELRFFLAGPSSSLNPPGDPWSTAAMPREDRATWKSNYFLKIIVSVGAAAEGGGPALLGRCAPWAWGRSRPAGSGREPGGRVSGRGLNKRWCRSLSVRNGYMAIKRDEDSPDQTVLKAPMRSRGGSYRNNLFTGITA